ncbi:MAG: carbohydrate-binding domain-containing protein [Lachnospiraceae bacterium]|jgi:hypothetical protein|nr:carbohydrate-binding domain-containing protein [Lachnospiraceae bacterium]MCI9134247.1 carbohydrate-binding domain-containing protein [Lachnospiraceae bacterium]
MRCSNVWNSVGLLLCVCLLAGCTNHEGSLEEQGAQTEEAVSSEKLGEEYETVFAVTRADERTENEKEILVDLSDMPNPYKIQDGGTYRLTGSLYGRICIEAEEQIVHLILDNASVYSGSGPAIQVNSAGKVVLTLAEDTVNTLQDSGTYQVMGEENACIYSMCDFTVNGSGALNIHGYYKDGIHSRDVVKILGGELYIQAKRDGIRGNDGILIGGGALEIESEGTGLHTTKSGKAGRGNIEILDGNVTMISGEYAVHAQGDLCVRECLMLAKGIFADLEAEGALYIQEECLQDE